MSESRLKENEWRLETKPAQYRVYSRKENHMKRESHIWLEVLSGADQGIRVSIPTWHDSYSKSLTDRIADLSPGDIIEAVLVSRRKRPPDWCMSSFEVVR